MDSRLNPGHRAETERAIPAVARRPCRLHVPSSPVHVSARSPQGNLAARAGGLPGSLGPSFGVHVCSAPARRPPRHVAAAKSDWRRGRHEGHGAHGSHGSGRGRHRAPPRLHTPRRESSPVATDARTADARATTLTAPAPDTPSAATLTAPSPDAPSPDAPAPSPPPGVSLTRQWAMSVLGLTYVHHSVCSFALPALLPQLSRDLSLADFQGALLTSGYSAIYAVSLIPAGYLADKLPRPQLLAGAALLWAALTASEAASPDFAALMLARGGVAAAQGVQNPVCFTLIPELFPQNRALALSLYNSFMYVGRALSFGILTLSTTLTHSTGFDGKSRALLVPLNQLDLSKVSILYVQGDMAAIVPIYDYTEATHVIPEALGAWRTILMGAAAPGVVVSALLLLTIQDPRRPAWAIRVLHDAFTGRATPGSAAFGIARGVRHVRDGLGRVARGWDDWRTGRDARRRRRLRRAAQRWGWVAQSPATGTSPLASALRDTAAGVQETATAMARVMRAGGARRRRRMRAHGEGLPGLMRELARNEAFLGVSVASAVVDVGVWSLISWQATFYERVFDLPSSTYAPLLAAIIPAAGILGGVGGGMLGDRLARVNRRAIVTAGCTCLAGPALAASLLSPSADASFAALFVGMALSEAWRANAAVIVRTVSPPHARSTATAAWLTTRNVTAAVGPLSVAALSGPLGLRHAMLLAPAAFVLGGLAFWWTEACVQRDYGYGGYGKEGTDRDNRA